MVLASQAARPTNRHRYMVSARRRRHPWLLAGAGVTIVVIGAWALTQSGNGPRPAAPPTSDASSSPVVATTPPQQPKKSPPSPTVTMGALAKDPAPTPPPTSTAPQTAASEKLTPKTPSETPEVASIPKNDTAERAIEKPAPPSASERVQRGVSMSTSDPVAARRILSAALQHETLSESDASRARETLRTINDILVFSPKIVPGDPHAAEYVVQRGDSLERIGRKQDVSADWRMLKRINRIADERKLREGQKIKIIAAPFHAVVQKSAYRLDLWLGDGDDRVLVRSFKVGLGEYNSTPTGLFRVRPKSKLIDPAWTNPRTGEHFASNDPKNPIGERWVGLEGVEDATRGFDGYGIHGTVEPDSIGRQMSMGCVRMAAEDIELVYEALTEPSSTIDIRP